MLSLFSSFDLHFFSYIALTFFLLISSLSNRVMNLCLPSVSWSRASSALGDIFHSFIPVRVSQGSLLVVTSLFFMMFFLNLYSVNSFNFPLGSQISMVLFMGFSVWLSFTLMSVAKNTLGTLAHLIPEGAPIYMALFLILIESVSLMIRPLTLSIRMMANILAGHLLMILLSSLVFSFSFASIFYVGLNLVEIFVACIQSYIFTVMIVLYYSDAK